MMRGNLIRRHAGRTGGVRWAAAFTVLAWAALAASYVRAEAAEAPGGRFAKPLALPTFDKEELASAPLDSDIYAATSDGFSDVRVLDAAGKETALVVRKITTKRSRTERRRVRVVNPTVHPTKDGALEITFVVDLEKYPKAPLGITLVTPLENFERHVSISSSTLLAGNAPADSADWTPLVTDGLVFDYSQFMDVHNRDLPLPADAGAARQYRIVIDDVTQEQQSQLMELTRNLQGDNETGRRERVVVNRQPFRIDQIELWYDVDVSDVAAERLTDYPLTGFRVEQDDAAKATYVFFDSRREPLTELTVDVADRNFTRAVHVEAEEVARPASSGREWPALGGGAISRLDVRALHREQLHVGLPESRVGRYRLVIENRDSAPLDVKGVAARGTEYEVVFLAKPGESYRLAYDGALSAPSYDTAAITASLAAGLDPTAAELGEQVAEATPPVASAGAFVGLLNDPKFLGGAIGLLVVLLAVGLYRATRRMDALPRDDA